METSGRQTSESEDVSGVPAEQQQRYQEAASLLRQWMQERDEFEEEIWPILEEELRNRRLRLNV